MSTLYGGASTVLLPTVVATACSLTDGRRPTAVYRVSKLGLRVSARVARSMAVGGKIATAAAVGTPAIPALGL